MDDIINGGYGELLGEIKTRIRTAQYEALRAVNKALIDLYWSIGKLIVEKQQGQTWGRSVVEKLSGHAKESRYFVPTCARMLVTLWQSVPKVC